MPARRPDPDRSLFLDALAAGLKLPSARKLAQLTQKEVALVADQEPEQLDMARKAGALARGAPHLVPEPEPLPEDRWWEYMRLVSEGKRPSQAAAEMGVRPIAIYLARQASVRFAEVERASEGAIVERVEDRLLDNALDGDTKAQLAFLQARAPERGWGAGGRGGGTVNIGTLNVNQSPDEMRARLERVRAELAAGSDDVIDAEIVEE